MLPEAVDMLNFSVFEIQSEFLRVFERGFNVGSIERPVVDGTGGQRCWVAFPGFDGQMAVTQECATVFTVMEQSRQLETEFLGIEFDGLVQILRRHAGMLQIGGEFRHWFGHNTLLVMVGTIRFSLL